MCLDFHPIQELCQASVYYHSKPHACSVQVQSLSYSPSLESAFVRGLPLDYLSPLSFLPFMDYLLLLSPVPSTYIPSSTPFLFFLPQSIFHVVWSYGLAVAI